MLLAALKLAIGDVTKDYGVSIDLEGHGREGLENNIDLSATVGWFTTIYPVTFNITTPDNLASTIKEVKRHLRKIPHNGVSYGIAVQKGKIEYQNSSIIFNYLGQLDNTPSHDIIAFGSYPIGNGFSRQNKTKYITEINGAVKNNMLSFEWKYTDDISQDIINKMLSRFEARFIELVQHCTNSENYTYTINDFDADLEEEELAYIRDTVSSN